MKNKELGIKGKISQVRDKTDFVHNFNDENDNNNNNINKIIIIIIIIMINIVINDIMFIFIATGVQ